MSTIASQSTNERILIGLDGSTPSEWAVRVGQQFAEQLNARVRLIHVTEPAIPIFADVSTADQIEKGRTQYGLNLLKETRLSFPPRLQVDIILRSGLPHEEIIAEARAWKATLVVVGTHGRNQLARLVMGSTAESVLRQSPCPVVVVGHPYVPSNIPSTEKPVNIVDTDTTQKAAAH